MSARGFAGTRTGDPQPKSAPPMAEMFAAYPDLLQVEHVHEITGLSKQTVRREINAGNLPGCRIGRRLYVPKCELIEYVGGGVHG